MDLKKKKTPPGIRICQSVKVTPSNFFSLKDLEISSKLTIHLQIIKIFVILIIIHILEKKLLWNSLLPSQHSVKT